MRLTGARLLWKMTKLKFSLLDVKLASRKQKRNEKRTRGELAFIKFPHLLVFFFFFFQTLQTSPSRLEFER